MKKNDVPQDQIKTLGGLKKAMYATDAEGNYNVVSSNGWEAEELVLEQALEEFERQCKEALARCRSGESSALEYHMFKKRMDLTVLAQSTGLFKWQVKRHLRSRVFNKLPAKKLQIYADALGLSVNELTSLPKH